MWKRVSSEQLPDIVSDLLENLERFRHAVVESSCRGILRFLARVGAVFVVFPSSVVSSISVGAVDCTSAVMHVTRHVHGSRRSARFISHFVSHIHRDVSFHHNFEHGSEAFVLTCGCCCWCMNSLECATIETSGYWYCGVVTQTGPSAMTFQ